MTDLTHTPPTRRNWLSVLSSLRLRIAAGVMLASTLAAIAASMIGVFVARQEASDLASAAQAHRVTKMIEEFVNGESSLSPEKFPSERKRLLTVNDDISLFVPTHFSVLRVRIVEVGPCDNGPEPKPDDVLAYQSCTEIKRVLQTASRGDLGDTGWPTPEVIQLSPRRGVAEIFSYHLGSDQSTTNIGIRLDDTHAVAYEIRGTHISGNIVRDEMLKSIIPWTAGLIVFLGIASWFIAGIIEKPIKRARLAAAGIAGGDLSTRLPIKGHDQLAKLSVDMNHMAESLQAKIDEVKASEKQQRQLLSDVAHELRTPLAALVSAATALENPATRDEAAAMVPPQLRRLATLTEDVLEMTRFDAGGLQSRPDLVNITELITAAVPEAHIRVSTSGDTSCEIDPARVTTIMRNLIVNAQQYGKEPIDISVLGLDDRVEVRLFDQGDGVPASLRTTLFDRFVRGDAARHGTGSGLGLAIARDNARLHGGDLTLDADCRTFVLTLPRTATTTTATTATAEVDEGDLADKH